MPRRETPDECSQCGAAIPPKALCCPACGADERTGWDVNPYEAHGDVDIPDYLIEDYDPDTDGPVVPGQPIKATFTWLVAVIVAAVLIVIALRR